MTNAKQEYIKKIDDIPTVSFNSEQKKIAKTIIANCDDKDLNAVFGLITQRVKTGFVFDEAPEVNHDAVALVSEDAKLNINVTDLEGMDENTEHKLIIGDNYDALKNLCATYIDKNGKGMVDVIYIDPPYNTEKSKEDGNDYKDQVEATKFIYRDKFTRDGWLNMMNERLKLARKLLSDKGVIFISIDDSEQAYLKVLCDEIFGEENFVANLVWQSTAGSNTGKTIVTLTEYILCYGRHAKEIPFKLVLKNGNYKLIDKHVEERGKYELQKLDGIFTTSHFSPSLVYPIRLPNGKNIYPGGNENKSEKLWNWRWSKTKVEWGIKNDFIDFIERDEQWTVYFKNYEKVDNNGKERKGSVPPKNIIGSEIATTATGTAQLNQLFDNSVFDFPKPTNLIKYLLSLVEYDFPSSANKSPIILDFFAGSGTTGQAVMELNAEDGGNRRFILVTNNENNIGEKITRERLYRVINGKGSKGESIQWKYKSDMPCLKNNSVRVFKIHSEALSLSDLAKAEKLKEQAKKEFLKLNPNYDCTNEIDIYNDLAALNPIKTPADTADGRRRK